MLVPSIDNINQEQWQQSPITYPNRSANPSKPSELRRANDIECRNESPFPPGGTARRSADIKIDFKGVLLL